MGLDKKLKPFGEIPESFKGLKENGIYYVDKTGFISYLIEQKRNICVFTRPRRFGKTLMLRTLQTFFEYALDDTGKPIDNRRYFEGLKVMDSGEEVLKEMGQYPVISVSLKGMRTAQLDDMVIKLRSALASACNPHTYLLEHPALLPFERERFEQILSEKITQGKLEDALGNLCGWIYKATGRKTVILLDEYDVPLQQAAIYDNHHPGSELFDKTVRLVGNFISSGFKSNNNLAYGIIAGCMRVAKESIFTGMNNPGVITVVDDIPDEFWGFTQNEVEKMLDYYELSDKMDALKHWYEGYFYSDREVYNPWSLLNAIRGLVNGYGENAIQSYWSMTSSNDIIEDMIDNNPQYRTELENLMNGGTKWVSVYKDLSYRDLKLRPDTIWSFLLYTGYLKSVEIKKDDDDLWIANVAVPNREILTVMKSAMQHWWKDIQIHGYNTKPLVNALVAGDEETVERELRLVLKSSTSVFDYNESFYHGMTVGLLQTVAEVHSNDEYEEGRPDVVTVIGDKGIILELRCVTPKALENAGVKDNDRAKIKAMMALKLDEAVKQINDNEYVEAVVDDEPAARSVLAYAVCFCRKQCMVRRVE